MKTTKSIVLCIICACVFWPYASFAEQVSGIITQQRSRGQYPIGYAEVTFCNSRCLSTFSASNGRFYLRQVPPGRYRVRVRLGGSEFRVEPRLIEVRSHGSNEFTILVSSQR